MREIVISADPAILHFPLFNKVQVVCGSALVALASGSFRWEGLAGVEDTGNHIVGGMLIGVGGVTAMGCTIGQGVTGLSTLSIGAFLTFAAIIAGCVATLKWEFARAG